MFHNTGELREDLVDTEYLPLLSLRFGVCLHAV